MPRDLARFGETWNLFTRGENQDLVELEVDAIDDRPLLDGDNLVDLRTDTGPLEAGDLVEVRYGARGPERQA